MIAVVVIGAGPYGLSAASHLRTAGIETRVVGEPMELWRRHMPTGMLLRSSPRASSIADPGRRRTIARWAGEHAVVIPDPVPVPMFLRYAAWFQEHEVPDIDRRRVSTLSAEAGGFTVELEDGERLSARRVVIAAGPARFARRPPPFSGLERERAVHTSDLNDPAGLRDRRVLVVGAGQSALETAALLDEAGAHVQLVARAPAINWLSEATGSSHAAAGGADPPATRRYRTLRPPPTGVGGRASGWLAAAPDVMHRSPPALERFVRSRCMRPTGAAWLRPRLGRVEVMLGRAVTSVEAATDAVRVELDDGVVREFETIVLGTGYAVDVRRYSFLSRELLATLRLSGGAPVLGRGLESSVARLHFLGAPAAASFGPLLNFVCGTWFAGPALADCVLGRHGQVRLGIPPE
jgi:cation diffusion facilitator CzcD-associated flavoprotein CzcO